MATTFENAKVGDKVWDFYYGWGKVTRIGVSEFGDTMAVLLWVEFNFNKRKAYKPNGADVNANYRTLFWDEIKFEIPAQPLRMKLIHGVEVPDISFRPKHGEDYYALDLTDGAFYVEFKWKDDQMDFTLYERDLCYPITEEGKQAAILHAKAMLGIKE